MSSLDLTTERDALTYFRQNGYPSCTRVEKLSGGHGGFVFRAYLDDSAKPKTVVAKHAEPFAAMDRSIELHLERLDYEHRGLRMLSDPSMAFAGRVRAPKPFTYDSTAHVIVMEDVGPIPSVKAWCTPENTDASIATKIGAMLGTHLANVHNFTAGNAEILEMFAGNVAARTLSGQYYFGSLAETAKKYGHDGQFLADAAKQAEEEVVTASEVFTLGDFWTGNVLLSTADAEPQMYLMDFELSKPGTAEFDIGQMAAELYALTAFRNQELGTALLENFLNAYKLTRNVSVDPARVAIRMGAHFVVITPWVWIPEAGEAKGREVIDLGVELVRIAWERDEEALSKSLVRHLM